MSILDITVYITIAISYNLFIHHLATILYKDLPFEERFDSSIMFIFIMGIVGLVISRIIIGTNKEVEMKDSVLSMGFGIGGLLLVLTAIIVSWEKMSDDLRLIISTGVFVGLVYVFYNYYERKDRKMKKRDTKLTTKISKTDDNIDDIFMDDL